MRGSFFLKVLTVRKMVLLPALGLSSCLPPKGIDASSSDRTGKKQGTSSGTAGTAGTVRFQMPALSSFSGGTQGTANSLTSTVQSIIIAVSPADKSCKGATKFAETVNYTDSAISKKLDPRCDYIFRVALGGKTSSGVEAVYYAMREGKQISKSQLQSGRVDIDFTLEASGSAKTMGFPTTITSGVDGGGSTPTTPTYTPQPTVSTPPTVPNPPPTPNNGLSGLPSNLANLSLQGAQSNVTLGSYWTTKYLYVEFSRPGCQPCVDMAGELSSEQSRFSGSGDCKALIVIPNQQLSSWHSAIGGAQTFAGKSSFAYSGSHDGFAGNFQGIGAINSTPTIALIDRTGRAVGLDVGQAPSQASQLCR